MKILELRFKNLNSLYGEWLLDFTVPEFSANGIFAITGPTGAGKSTILDAICLALYGATPRLGRITAKSNEIMSRQTGDCFAEVTFESASGRFRCHWSQHRARKKSAGKLAQSRHEIADAVSGQILESKKRDVARVIEKHTGMDFDRFTRSALLAQGGFAAFLQATPDKRAPVLEQITGTKIYSEISQKVHERYREEKNSLELLQAQLQGIELLTDEQVSIRNRELAEKEKIRIKLAADQEQTGKLLHWLLTIETLKSELDELSRDKDRVNKAVAAFAPERDRLDLAQKAVRLDGVFAPLSVLRQQQKQEQKDLVAAEKNLPQLQQALERQEVSLEKAGQAKKEAKEAQKKGLRLVQEVRGLDLQIQEKTKTQAIAAAEYNKSTTEHERQQAGKQKILNSRQEEQKKLEEADAYLKEHVSDETLATGLGGMTEQLDRLKFFAEEIASKKKTLSQQQKLLAKKTQHLKEWKQKSTSCAKAYESALANYQASRNQLESLLKGRLLREYRAELENLSKEMMYLQRISSLEEERKRLEDGAPCPLCGSLDHPFVAGNIPQFSEKEQERDKLARFVEAAEERAEKSRAEERKKQEAESRLAEAEKQLQLAGQSRDEAERSGVRLSAEMDILCKQLSAARQTVLAGLQPLGIDRVSEKEIDTLLQELGNRQDKYQEHKKSADEIARKITGLNSEIKVFDSHLVSIKATLGEKKAALEGLTRELDLLKEKRGKIFGKKDPEHQEHLLEKAVQAAERKEQSAQQERERISREITVAASRVEALQSNIASRKPELQSLEKRFMSGYVTAGFADEQVFLQARISAEEINKLEQQAQELAAQQAETATRLAERKSRLLKEEEKQCTDASPEELNRRNEELRASLEAIAEETGAIKQTLARNIEAREKLKHGQQKIEDQKRECARWEKLHALIGSADGKKYRNFAQGITFELMVSHANRQLAEMTDRYLLIRDAREPLELNVIDNYQAGEVRSTKNLSGGESFIVSLALALGLSKMASRRVRVDSLFLDEGFGTLDEDALETALETLSTLQQDGKLIGIISHVSALKERIATRINILPVSGGRSCVTGPGCKGISH